MSPRPQAAGQPAARMWLYPALAGLALLTFFQFPGHTWLQQDTQIYVPILEHLRNPAVLRNDPVAQHPHVAFTLYDEIALALRRATGLGFRPVLEAQQVVTRAFGIWGLFLLAAAFGLSPAASLTVAAICSLGATVAGPSVLTFEYEPTPRAFALPLIFCAIGLAANRRWMAAAIAGSAAFLYHPPTAFPFWLLFAGLLLLRRRWRELALAAGAAALLLVAAHAQGGRLDLFSRLSPAMEHVQRLRASYVWISTWPAAVIEQYVILCAIVLLAAARLWAQHSRAKAQAIFFLLGLPFLGLVSLPLSWLLLEHLKWSLMPQLQPMRAVLFVILAAQFLSAAAALRARSRVEAFFWFAVAFLPPIQPLLFAPWSARRAAVLLALAALCSLRPGLRLPGALAAFFVIPLAAGVVNYPRLHTPELSALSAWARASTPPDSVFLFPASGRALEPGIFRSEALRAVYVDWKGGGQVNYLNDFAAEWWNRWQQTMARPLEPSDLPRFSALGIRYVAIPRGRALPLSPVFANSAWCVYRLE